MRDKTLGVFIFYDKEGIVDRYVLYLLDSLKDATDEIIIVSNAYLDPREKVKLKKYSDKIIIRHNVGLDAGAFKEVYDIYKEYFKSFKELLVVNDTFYGPFIPFKDICKEMSKKEVDFWGLSANYDSVDGYGFLPDKMIHSHIQTFFIAFRNKVLNSKAFNDYWEKYDISKRDSFLDVVTKHELFFTHYLEQAGFKWDVYTNLEKYHSKFLEENFNCYAYVAYDMIKNLNCPFVKRKNFVFDRKDALFLTDGSDARKSLDYIKDNKLYDTDMIYENLIRLYNPNELYYGLNLNYIVKESKVSNNIGVCIILEEVKTIDLYIDYIKNSQIDIIVFTDKEEILKVLKDNKIKVYDKEKFNYKKYDYLVILKDSNHNKQRIPTVYNDNIINCFSNGIGNNNYLNGIGNIFKENKYLGLLLIPSNYHSSYFEELSDESAVISANNNLCIIKSELFNWELIDKSDFVKEYINYGAKKYLVGKIYNLEELPNILTNQEYIIKKTYQSLRTHHEAITSSFSEAIYFIEHTKSNLIPDKFLVKILKKIKNRLKR